MNGYSSLFEGKPDAVAVARIGALSALGAPHNLEPLGDEDWVTMSQVGLEPVIRALLRQNPYDPAEPPPGSTPFIIDAGRAFGTGHHETTSGCLEMIDRIAVAGHTVDWLVDLGTGTGLLAYAGLALWPEAYALATDLTLSRLRSQRIMPSSTASRWAGNPVNAR